MRPLLPRSPAVAPLTIAWLLLAPPAHAQGQRAAGPNALRAARRAQTQFEATRRQHLPNAPRPAPRCDVRIGRFCYWYDEAEPEPPPEPRRIARARDALVRALDSAAVRTPGDPWIAGQRVRYLVEARQVGAARAAAAACTAPEPGWCAALAGLAAHAAGDALAADSAFAAALAAFPAAERCRWTDLAVLLDEPLRRRYRRLSCAARDTLNERLWWLARPLYSRPGNALRAEHHARLTMARIQQATRTPLDPAWGDDLRELGVRYGWSTAYSRDRSREGLAGGGASLAVTGYEARPSYSFFPAPRAVDRPADAQADDWNLAAPLAPTRYAPGVRLAPLTHQSAAFRRGDSVLVVAAYDVAADTNLAGAALDAALHLWRDERTEPVTGRVVQPAPPPAPTPTPLADPPRAVLLAAAPWTPALVGVELVARDRPQAARARYGFAPRPAPAPIALSDVLLYEPAELPPASLAAALPAMRPRTRARRGERVGLLWEVYGLADTARAVTVSLGTERVGGPGLVRRAAERLGVRRPPAPVRLRFGTPAANTAGVATGAITLRLADLPPGRYRITVDVRTASGDSASTAREIDVVK